MVVRTVELIYKKKNSDKFKKYINSKGEVELTKLIESGTVTIGYIKERSFSDKINKLLAQNEKNGKMQPIMTQNAVEGDIKKLEIDRVDCILESGTVVEYYKRLNDMRLDYTRLKIVGVPEFTYVYAIFSKNKFGEEAKNRIDKLMDKKRYEDSYINIINRWTTPEDNYKNMYMNGMKKYFELKKE